MTKRRMEQLTVASMEKAIEELLLAHKAITDAWFAQWEVQQKERMEKSLRQTDSAEQNAA